MSEMNIIDPGYTGQSISKKGYSKYLGEFLNKILDRPNKEQIEKEWLISKYGPDEVGKWDQKRIDKTIEKRKEKKFKGTGPGKKGYYRGEWEESIRKDLGRDPLENLDIRDVVRMNILHKLGGSPGIIFGEKTQDEDRYATHYRGDSNKIQLSPEALPSTKKKKYTKQSYGIDKEVYDLEFGDEYLAEISHGLQHEGQQPMSQFLQEEAFQFYHLVKGMTEEFLGIGDTNDTNEGVFRKSYEKLYDIPGTKEYGAHSIIQPELESYIKTGKLSEDAPDWLRGSLFGK